MTTRSKKSEGSEEMAEMEAMTEAKAAETGFFGAHTEEFGKMTSGPFRSLAERIFNFAVEVGIRRAREQAEREGKSFDEQAVRDAIKNERNTIGDGQIWDWLINGGFEKILAWVEMIIKLITSLS